MKIFSRSSKQKVIEIKSFLEIPEFSFDYPVFDGWNPYVRKVNEKEYVLFFSKDKNYELPKSQTIEGDLISFPRITIKRTGICIISPRILESQLDDQRIRLSLSKNRENDKTKKLGYLTKKTIHYYLYDENLGTKDTDWDHMLFLGTEYSAIISRMSYNGKDFDNDFFNNKILTSFTCQKPQVKDLWHV